MHEIAEIVLPPNVTDIKSAVSQVMDCFREEKEDQDGNITIGDADWWDYWQIGGRWTGNKIRARFDDAKLKEFSGILQARGVTISGFQSGKQELNPSSQIPMVDALWREMFPGGGEKCVLFAHSGNSGDIIDGNVCTVADLPDRLSCDRLIIAGFHYTGNGVLEASDMLQESFWNGHRHQKTDFDGNVKAGIVSVQGKQQEIYDRVKTRDRKDEQDAKECEEWLLTRSKSMVGEDWLVVTVDYHN